MAMETDAKEALILKLLDGYSDQKVTAGFIDALCRTADPFPVDVVAATCDRIASGESPNINRRFLFNQAEFAHELRTLSVAMHPPKRVPIYSGILDVNFGYGRVDLRGLNRAEQERIFASGGKTRDGRNMAFLTLEEKKHEVLLLLPAPKEAPGALPPPPKRVHAPRRALPKPVLKGIVDHG